MNKYEDGFNAGYAQRGKEDKRNFLKLIDEEIAYCKEEVATDDTNIFVKGSLAVMIDLRQKVVNKLWK